MEPDKKQTPVAPTTPVAQAAPTAPIAPAPATNEHHIKSLRTYQGDMADALSKNNGSISSVVIAEQKRREKTLDLPKEQARSETRNKVFLFIGIILALIGIIGVAIVYSYVMSNKQVVTVQKALTPIAYSQEDNLPVMSATRAQLVATIQKETADFKLPVNSVLYVNTTNASSTPQDIGALLPLLVPHIPNSLVRAFNPEYMLGVYSNDINAPFIILTTSDYATSYSGMLKWEATMPQDLGDVFGIRTNLATTTTFTDEALNNYDLRIVTGLNGKTVLLYSFLDKNTLLITTNENVFTGIVSKFLVNKTMQQ